MTDIITDATALSWFDQFKVIADDRLCPEMTLIFADWLEDVHGLDSWTECLRWMVAEGKFPVRGFEDCWWGTGSDCDELPDDLVELVGRDEVYLATTIGKPTPQAAILAVMKVWHQREGE